MILLQTVVKWRCIKLCAIFSGPLCATATTVKCQGHVSPKYNHFNGTYLNTLRQFPSVGLVFLVFLCKRTSRQADRRTNWLTGTSVGKYNIYFTRIRIYHRRTNQSTAWFISYRLFEIQSSIHSVFTIHSHTPVYLLYNHRSYRPSHLTSLQTTVSRSTNPSRHKFFPPRNANPSNPCHGYSDSFFRINFCRF